MIIIIIIGAFFVEEAKNIILCFGNYQNEKTIKNKAKNAHDHHNFYNVKLN